MLIITSIFCYRCLHKTGGALAYTPSKCVRIIECCCRLHNRAIEDRIPAPATGQVPIFSDNDTFNAETSDWETTGTSLLVSRFSSSSAGTSVTINGCISRQLGFWDIWREDLTSLVSTPSSIPDMADWGINCKI